MPRREYAASQENVVGVASEARQVEAVINSGFVAGTTISLQCSNVIPQDTIFDVGVGLIYLSVAKDPGTVAAIERAPPIDVDICIWWKKPAIIVLVQYFSKL